jgi:hypothetical protein
LQHVEGVYVPVKDALPGVGFSAALEMDIVSAALWPYIGSYSKVQVKPTGNVPTEIEAVP